MEIGITGLSSGRGREIVKTMKIGFYTVRFTPYLGSDEFVNIGVIAYDPARNEFAVAFTRDWRRVLCLDPDADVDRLARLEKSLQRDFARAGKDGDALLAHFEDSWSLDLQLSANEVVEAEDVSWAAASMFRERVFRAGDSIE